MLFTYLISLILLIDQGLFNLLIISQSIHSRDAWTHSETQMEYVGFVTNTGQGLDPGYTRYIQTENKS